MNLILLLAVVAVGQFCVTGAVDLKAAFASSRIIDGHDAKPHEARYIVSLRTSSHFCAGSILAENWVVTAGHCLAYPSFYVVAGLHDRRNESRAQIRRVENDKYYIIHKGYGGDVGPNDIGLIYIAEPFIFNEHVNKISLPTGKCRLTGNGVLYGWGIDNSGSLPSILQVLNTTIVSYLPCKGALPLGAPIARSNVCSYNKGEHASSCNGDSGGPLVKYTKCGLVLVGIVSWGYIPCATTSYPSVYTGTPFHHEWIVQNIRDYEIPEE